MSCGAKVVTTKPPDDGRSLTFEVLIAGLVVALLAIIKSALEFGDFAIGFWCLAFFLWTVAMLPE